MADYSMYHAMGEQDREHPSIPTQPAPPQFQPQVAQPPQGYQQSGSAYGPNAAGPDPQQYGGQPVYHNYGGNLSQPGVTEPGLPAQNNVEGLTSQMGGFGLGDGTGGTGPAKPQKKKNRHAYHNIEGPAAPSAPFPGMPSAGGQAPGGQYLNDPSQQLAPGGQYINQQNAPAMSPGISTDDKAPFNPALRARTNPTHGGSFSQTITTSGGGAPGSSQQGRVDPEQIPSVPQSRDGPAQFYLNHVYPTLEHHLPPPASVPFVAHDQGNSSPKFARLTLNNIPSTSEALTSTGLPLGLLLQPLAALQEGEQPIPVLDFGESGPPRCRRCRAYVNPFMSFRNGGNRFVCNMCTFPNETPADYFSPTDPQGVRVDREQRPELTRGTVEFMVPREYWAKDPVGLRWLFVIDVGQEAANRGYLETFCEGILNALYSEDGLATPDDETGLEEKAKPRNLPAGSKVGIVTYDKDMHFYNLSVSNRTRSSGNAVLMRPLSQASLEKAQMMVMPDIDEPFVPLSEGLFVDPYESQYEGTAFPRQIQSLICR